MTAAGRACCAVVVVELQAQARAGTGAMGTPLRSRTPSQAPTDLAGPLQQLLIGGGGAHQRVGGVQRGGGVAAAAAQAGA